jgi:CheY-like chemotaxis protein
VTAERDCLAHVLCVDDEAALAELTARALTRLGYRVSAFTDSEGALEALRSSPDSFDAMLTDLAMPGMSGLDLARAVRKIRPDMPIVIASGYLRKEDIEAAASLGICDVVLKPDLLNGIGGILRALLARGG